MGVGALRFRVVECECECESGFSGFSDSGHKDNELLGLRQLLYW